MCREIHTKNLIKRFNFDVGTIVKTPVSTSTKLHKDEKGKCVDIKFYRSMIGSPTLFNR